LSYNKIRLFIQELMLLYVIMSKSYFIFSLVSLLAFCTLYFSKIYFYNTFYFNNSSLEYFTY
jgi:hypothetical protein